jgi:cytosine/adenosine deaminase-related metal-dependent hydrolase
MILRGARVALSARRAGRIDIAIGGGVIRALGEVGGARGIDCSGYLVLPGLINAHDHLEFNLFPRLGNGPYRSAGDWARDIHRSFSSSIRRVLKVPLADRLLWGGIKNLLSGVTTVCHHNPWHRLFAKHFPVRVLRAFSWGHSLEFERDLRARHACCPAARPFVFHAGEATSAAARQEMEQLDSLGLFAPNAVMVHAVGLAPRWTARARERGCTVVWCPSSNLFTLGRTLPRRVLSSGLPVALGTDSALTAQGDMHDELRVARAASGLGTERLYRMVTDIAAQVLRLRRGEGTLRPGGVADLVFFRDDGHTPADTLLASRPEAALVAGRLEFATPEFAAAWPGLPSRPPRIAVNGRTFFLRRNAPAMAAGLALAGRQVTS